MKLNEILIKNKVVRYEASAPSGKRFVVVDESMNRVISVHATKESAKKTIPNTKVLNESSAPVNFTDFTAGEIFQIGSGRDNRVGIGLGTRDEIIEFVSDSNGTARQKAEAFLDSIDPADRADPDKLRVAAGSNSASTIRNWRGRWEQLDRRRASATASTFEALENIPRVGPSLSRLFGNPVTKRITMIFAILPAANLLYQNLDLINQLQLEAEDDPSRSDELRELADIIISQTIVMAGTILWQIMRQKSLFNRALRTIKWTVRAAQGATATTGIGAVPAVLSFLITEAAWVVAAWVMTSQTVQRGIAEWLQGTWAREVFATPGAWIAASTRILDDLFDGQFGTRELRNGLNWRSREEEAVEDGEFASSSEWAKLVFHGLLFPPARENLLVPYIGPEQRATLLRQTLGITEETTATQGDSAADVELDDAVRAAQPQTSEPGMPVNPDARTGPQ